MSTPSHGGNGRAPFRLKPYSIAAKPHLKFVVVGREAGTRKRWYFATKGAASAHCDLKNKQARRQGIEGAEFSSALRVEAQKAVEKLKSFNKTITDAVEHYLAHLKASEKSCTAVELVDEIVAAKKADGRSLRHLDDLRSRLNIFAKAFDGQTVATITTAHVDDWLRSLGRSPVTRNHYRRLLVLAFNFAIARGYAVENPADKTAKAKEVWTPPEFLTVSQTARLLESASPDMLPYFAVGALAGLRRAEIGRLDWSEIDFESDSIEVSPENKTSHRRVEMQPNLRAWLLPVRKHRGPVMPADFDTRFDQVRVAAGITEWPYNALRHGYASYRLAHIKDAARVAYEMGTSEPMVKKNYDGRAKPRDAERYWNLTPAATKKVVPMVAR